MIIDCISDLHGHYPTLEGGDLLIVAGDFTARDLWEEVIAFRQWIRNKIGADPENYRKVILVPGNHDNSFQKGFTVGDNESPIETLVDRGTEFEGLKIWGSPWTRSFKGMNQHYMAFTLETQAELAEKWALIPDDVEILITHSPILGFGDINARKNRIGSSSLLAHIPRLKNLRLHVCGHNHAGYGVQKEGSVTYVNAAQVDEAREFRNKPVRVVL